MQSTTTPAADAALSDVLRDALIYSEPLSNGEYFDDAFTLLLAVLYQTKPGAEITIRTDALLGVMETMESRVRGARASLTHLRRAVHQHFGLPISPADAAAFAETQP